MRNAVVMSMQQDRLAGNTSYQHPDVRDQQLAAMGAKNVLNPPLPLSPCLKVISTGEVHVWTPSFAARPDLVVNCDEQGNTDPQAWQGRHPSGVTIDHKQVDIYEEYKKAVHQDVEEAKNTPPIDFPPGLLFNLSEWDDSSSYLGVPDVGNADIILGTPPGVIQSFVEKSRVHPAAPITGGNVNVADTMRQAVQRGY